jgi:hypothetical protein
MEFTGRLAAFPASSLLQWAWQEHATGTLVVRRSSAEKRVGLRRGRVVECRSNQPRELFGRFLLDHDRVTVEQVSGALALGRERGLPLGRALLEGGALSEEAIVGLLRRWMSEAIQDLFLWSRGVFYFDEHEPRSSPLEIELDVRELALEGTHWFDEHARLRKLLPDDGVVLGRGQAWPGVMLEPFEERIAKSVTAETTLGALRGAVGGVDYPFLVAVQRLINAGVLTIERHQPVDLDASHELRVADVLLELEAQEGGVKVRGERAIVPMDVFEGLVPLWIQPPEDAEIAELANPLRSFLAGFDGRTTLRRLLAADQEAQADQIDLLLLQLRKRAIVLLPANLDEIERRLPPGGALRALLRRLRG